MRENQQRLADTSRKPARVISVEIGRQTVAFDKRDQVRGLEHE